MAQNPSDPNQLLNSRGRSELCVTPPLWRNVRKTAGHASKFSTGLQNTTC